MTGDQRLVFLSRVKKQNLRNISLLPYYQPDQYLSLLKYMLVKGADVIVNNGNGFTALPYATTLEVAKFFYCIVE